MAKYHITIETPNCPPRVLDCEGYLVGAFSGEIGDNRQMDISIHDICDEDLKNVLRVSSPFRKNVATLAGEALASLIEVILEPDEEIKQNEHNADPVMEDEEDAAE